MGLEKDRGIHKTEEINNKFQFCVPKTLHTKFTTNMASILIVAPFGAQKIY